MNERKLATILFTDAVNSTGLMSQHEDLSIQLMSEDMALFREYAEKHNGKVVKSTGDGVLVIFDSAVSGVQATLEMARALSLRPNADRRIQHRFGIHLGDVVHTDQDVLGDGVNIAARLQSEAPIGGIAMSKTLLDVVTGKTPVPAVRVGETHLKHISLPVEMWHILPESLETQLLPRPAPSPKSERPMWLVMVVAVLVIGGIAYAFRPIYSIGRPTTGTGTKEETEVVKATLDFEIESVAQGLMREGPHAGKPSLDLVVRPDGEASGVQTYDLDFNFTEPQAEPQRYELSALVMLVPRESSLIQVPLHLIQDSGLAKGTTGQVTLTIANRTKTATCRLEGFVPEAN